MPSGASTGEREAVGAAGTRDEARFGGEGVEKAVSAVLDEIGPELAGIEADRWAVMDHGLVDLDGTPDKGQLGANALLGVASAVAKAAAESSGLELFRYVGGPNAHVLPVPMMNIVNGGAHADGPVDVQEFIVAPIGAESYKEALRWGAEVYQALKSERKGDGLATGFGDVGGFAPDLPGAAAALDVIARAVDKAGFTLGRDIALALDVAANELYSEGVVFLEGRKLSSGELTTVVRRARRRLPTRVPWRTHAARRLGRLDRASSRAVRWPGAGRRGRPVQVDRPRSGWRFGSPGGRRTHCW